MVVTISVFELGLPDNGGPIMDCSFDKLDDKFLSRHHMHADPLDFPLRPDSVFHSYHGDREVSFGRCYVYCTGKHYKLANTPCIDCDGDAAIEWKGEWKTGPRRNRQL